MMVSLPSGSREDVELVIIETEDLSLVIKGKPYHERYEGLRQYQSMDFNDIMELEVRGKEIQCIKVYDVNQLDLVDWTSDLRPIFFENGIYQLIVIPKKEDELTFYHEHPLLRNAISKLDLASHYMLLGNLKFQNEIGYTSFEIKLGNETLLEVTLEIFPTKLDYKKDYQKLLKEVNDEIYNLSYHFIRKTYLGASIKQANNPSMVEFYRLIKKHFSQFLEAIKLIELQPHHQMINKYVKARGDQLRRVDSRGRKYLRNHPSMFVEVEYGIKLYNQSVMPMKGLRIKKELTIDTLENRFVKFMMGRLVDKLTDLLYRVRSQRKWDKDEKNTELIDGIQKMIMKLEGKRRSPFWARIGRLDRSLSSLILQMAPGYRDAYQIFLTVSKGLILQGKFYQMSVKDVATLYEYWTFLKLGQILSKRYELVSQDIVKINNEGLFVNLEGNRTAKRIYRHPITKEKIELTYQKYEGNLPTLPQKPDTMLSIEKKGKDYSYRYIFDAKYRIDYAQKGSYYQNRYQTPGPMEEDINTMHRYRDSIVTINNGPYERTAFGAYVLFPWFQEDIYKEHHFYKSINEVNIGALPFLPNATTLVEQFLERLIDSSPEDLQREGILPRGAKEHWYSAHDEKVIVGLISSKEDFHSFIREGIYQLPVRLLRKGWQEAKYIALYKKSGVADIQGINEYGKITDVTIIQLQNEEWVRFHVGYWDKLSGVISPVHYGIATYAMTSLNILKEARELPELFMKTNKEVIIWRMLRRVSDQIRISLDQRNIDEASRIDSFSIKDITIIMENNTKEIIFIKENQEVKVPVDMLDKQPSMVFKMLQNILVNESVSF
jgi:uncharacterized protein